MSDSQSLTLTSEHAKLTGRKSFKKLFDKYAHNLQWDNVTLGKISGELQSKINSEFPEARFHYKTHMIATHLPDHFLPRRVFRLTVFRLTNSLPI